jgi:acetyl-CoA C-acetyltransferase
MLAFPYTKLHNSQWNVDQAAGLIFTSAAFARREGVPEHQWVHPRAVVESNYMLPLVHRAELHRCAAFRIAGRRAAELASLRLAQLAHLELYSCFPVAVRVQQFELGIPRQRPVTVTGGMAFAGGPLNNFVLQAAVRLAQRLRAEPGGAGMLNAVSGMLTKQGVSLWSSGPGPAFAAADVSAEAQRETRRVELAENFSGTARVAGYTVLFDGDRPNQTIVLADTAEGARAVAVGDDPRLAAIATTSELCGREVEISAGGVRLLD